MSGASASNVSSTNRSINRSVTKSESLVFTRDGCAVVAISVWVVDRIGVMAGLAAMRLSESSRIEAKTESVTLSTSASACASESKQASIKNPIFLFNSILRDSSSLSGEMARCSCKTTLAWTAGGDETAGSSE